MISLSNTGNEEKERPLISFLLLAYNQEQYIRDAVEGAFSQTYSPLEIIFSDDHSSDRTFDIISEMVRDYTGHHKIVLNRNEVNLGIGTHVNHVVSMTQGALFVMAAGDDISLPERTQRTYDEWCRSEKKACSLYSDGIIIDAEGNDCGRLYDGHSTVPAQSIEEAVRRGRVGISGCSHAFSRNCFDVFGPMDECVVAEDMAIPFRSLLLGTIRFIDAPLVRYRTHSGSISGNASKGATLQIRCRDLESHEAVLFTWLKDLRKAIQLGLVSPERGESVKRQLFFRIYWLTLERIYYRSSAGAGLILLFKSIMNLDAIRAAGKIIERKARSKKF